MASRLNFFKRRKKKNEQRRRHQEEGVWRTCTHACQQNIKATEMEPPPPSIHFVWWMEGLQIPIQIYEIEI